MVEEAGAGLEEARSGRSHTNLRCVESSISLKVVGGAKAEKGLSTTVFRQRPRAPDRPNEIEYFRFDRETTSVCARSGKKAGDGAVETGETVDKSVNRS